MIGYLHKMPKQYEFLLVLKTHLAEYRGKPLLNLGFILSLAIATSTLLCILVLNHASKAQYQTANTRLKSPIDFYIVSKSDKGISRKDFQQLKAQGFHQLTPLHLFRKTLPSGQKINFRALDILPLAITMPDSFSINHINLSKNYAQKLGINPVASTTDRVTNKSIQVSSPTSLSLNDPQSFYFNTINDWGQSALIDLPLAWQMFEEIKGYSHLIAANMSDTEQLRLLNILPQHLIIEESWALEEREGFADALHLNLSALAILGFIVSLFIAFQAANQAWQKRAELAAKLRLLGVTLTTIKTVMCLEAGLLTVTASIVGSVIAFVLVSVLLPILGLTLAQLYQLQQTGHFQWQWLYSLWALAISGLAVLLALLKQFRVIGSAHIALTNRLAAPSLNFTLCGALGALLFVVFLLWPNQIAQGSWHQLMLKYGVLLLASVALLPHFLRGLLGCLTRLKGSFRFHFVLKDACQQIGRRYLPLAAFYLAMTASISAALMVNSFEKSFSVYLDQLLSSDVFIRYNPEQKRSIQHWLNQQDNIDEFVIFQQTTAKYDGQSIEVHALMSPKQTQSLLIKSGALYSKKHTKPAKAPAICYANEQLSLRHGIQLHQAIKITQGKQVFTCSIKAFFYDYGNQGLAIKIPSYHTTLPFSGWREQGIGVFFNTDSKLTMSFLAEQLQLDDDQLFEPVEIKKQALAIFNQTFILTQAIAFILLVIACFGLFLSANNLELARKPDLHILSGLGYSQMGLLSHMLIQWLLLALGVLVLSWPIASLLANALVSKILPASFGWSMPLVFDITPFAFTSMLGLVILLPALTIPLYKLNTRASL
jgi:putative ABC transport system permease protein